MDPFNGYALISAGKGLSGYLSGQGAQREAGQNRQLTREQMNREDARRRQAQTYLSGYSYTPYSQAGGQGASVLANYLRGNLPIGQQNVINQNRDLGMSAIDRRSAGAGTPSGGRAALNVQLQRDLALGAGQMAGQQQQIGLQASMADYFRQQEAENQRRQLQAQYAPGA
jgi:hypothetical protein